MPLDNNVRRLIPCSHNNPPQPYSTMSYETTKHVLRMFDLKDDDHSSDVVRHDILDCDGSAFVLHNFLTRQECQFYIHQAETFGMEPCGYRRFMRVTDRVYVQSQAVANQLFERLLPFLDECGVIDLSNDDKTKWPTGIPWMFPKQRWTPVGLNEGFRLCRYEPGGFFTPHFDGGFMRSPNNRSIKTFMIYLNDDFEGGCTNFYNEKQMHYQQGDPENVVYSFQPQAGDALVFNSKILHDGGAVTAGRKYIMRSEVMYSAPLVSEEKKSYPPDHDSDVDFGPD